MPKAPAEQRPKADSDIAIKLLNEPGRYSEGSIKGLYLQVTATSKLWRYKFRLDGKEGLYAIGVWPDFNHDRAVELAQEARTSVAEGIAPLRTKRKRIEAERNKEGWTFKKVAEQWLELNSHLKPKTLSGHRGVLKNHLYPVVGDVPVTDIVVRHVRTILERLTASPTMARHSLTLMRLILSHAMDHDLVSQNVAIGREGLLKKHKTKHHAALIKEADLAEFLRRLNNFVAYNDPVISALWLLVLLPARPAELTDMRWEQVDFDKAEWRYTMSKTDQPHIVPLPTQAVAQLRALREHSLWLGRKGVGMSSPFGKTAASESAEPAGWVFPSSGKFGRPISADTLLVRIRTGLGYERGTITSHGFRSTFRSLSHELGSDPVVLEMCLGHLPLHTGGLGKTYAKAQLLDKRREAMQKWADYVEGLWAKVAFPANVEHCDAVLSVIQHGDRKD
ncbi:tyrosine-type recombinase/integrase [Pseudomonas fluorescens]|uniref:tyrosine-type recombinase/integrase n=1 Tax=Pseudomonas fluorescens TaxID=294 RepID=UPI003C2843C1